VNQPALGGARQRPAFTRSRNPYLRPGASLLVTMALATLGVACPNGNSPTPDGSAGTGGGAGGRGGSGGADGSVTGGSSGRDGAAGSGGTGGRQDAGGVGGRDAAAPRDAPVRDTPQGPVDARPPDLRPDAGAGPDAGVNPRQLWFSGPESDLHLSDIEPQVPF
jgi:hypothetical protein